jgi:hypothetical protein
LRRKVCFDRFVINRAVGSSGNYPSCKNMSAKSKKGRNPAAVDNWLDSIGLYRKNVAYDETCLFRAVSEQVSAKDSSTLVKRHL